MSIIMLDIDYFKMINDTYGHLIDDKVLKKIFTVSKGTLRSSDIPGRYAGEEFLIILPNTNIKSVSNTGKKSAGKLKSWNGIMTGLK